jgi:hypothetical protein
MASVAPLIAQLARQYGLDPSAVLAVARGEGGLVNRPGTADIGDLAGGGSYGPFQLYAQGALPRHLVGNRQRADSWAWSPEGIRYALSKMASSGARGLSGADAVRAIVTRFERPANPQASIANALGRLGSSRGRYDQPPNPGQWDDAWNNVEEGRAPNKGGRQRELTALRGALGKGPLAMIMALEAAGGTVGAPQVLPRGAVSPVQPLPLPGGGTGGFNPAELFYDPLGAFKNGQKIAPIGGHSDHVHAAFQNAQQVRRAIALARQLGLRVSENPLVDQVDPVHTKGSYHYRRLAPGVGAAIDVSGNPARMASFYRSLAPRSKAR